MLFRANPNSKLGRRFLRARLAYYTTLHRGLAEKADQLLQELKEMDQSTAAFHDKAFLAYDEGNLFSFCYWRFCGKFAHYRWSRLLRRLKKLIARQRHCREQVKVLCELLGYVKK